MEREYKKEKEKVRKRKNLESSLFISELGIKPLTPSICIFTGGVGPVGMILASQAGDAGPD